MSNNIVFNPKKFVRNEYGLLESDSVIYQYNEQGAIDWRAMIKPEFIAPNKQFFDKKGMPVPESTDGLEDNQLLILLGGIKDLAQIRGYSHVEYKVTSPSPDYVVAVCKITWIPNFETNQPIVFSAIGDASPSNTSGFGKEYLGPIAENRAFVRAVRNFLKINIVSSEELKDANVVTKNHPTDFLLKSAMDKYNVSFEKIKEKLIKENVDGAVNFTSVNDIPPIKKFELLERINKAGKQKEQERIEKETSSVANKEETL